MNETQKGDFLGGLLIGLGFLGLLFLVKLIEEFIGINFAQYGLWPMEPQRIYGILTIPFIHGSWDHLKGNASSLLVLTTLLFWLYRDLYLRVTLMVVLLGGFWTWVLGRQGVPHIGASGLLYGYMSFLFFAGVIGRNYRIMAISMLIVFLYGGLFWGIFPLRENISWEAHLTGALAGVVAAVYYRDRLPKRPAYDWELEEEEEEDQQQEEERAGGSEEQNDKSSPPENSRPDYLVNWHFKKNDNNN